jgi:hypothetical protein
MVTANKYTTLLVNIGTWNDMNGRSLSNDQVQGLAYYLSQSLVPLKKDGRGKCRALTLEDIANNIKRHMLANENLCQKDKLKKMLNDRPLFKINEVLAKENLVVVKEFRKGKWPKHTMRVTEFKLQQLKAQTDG